MFNKAMFDKLISVTRICVDDRYFILREYPDKISLQHIYFLKNGLEEQYKKDYIVLSSDQLISLLYMKNDSYVVQMHEEAHFVENEGSL